ncbi:SDR family oxidoreductase [Clostridium chromiireducens]|uniref:Putative oxidoreductase n=1 Tax=Clostridium chromiireducens TaxID=225345 RepID=A0A1V4ISR4_9CLOT|nr:SDR family oxidoreductase [Clostridium chromiireducens]OPJ62507.1 putative oxidoreductase [Clostridium chromiireducens]
MKLPFNIDLNNKVVVVTGGAGVLGSSWVDALAECGAKVAILDRSIENAERKAAEVVANGKIALGVQANVLDKTSLKKAHEIILEKFGPCDILINGAGGNNPKGTTTKEYLYEEDLYEENKDLVTFFDLDEDGIRFVFDLNFLGTLLPSQEFSRDMIGKKGCSIINVSSMNAFTPLTKIPAYSGAKSAVSNFTKWLAVHMSKVGIRVNAIAPGFFVTKQNEALLKNADGSYTERSHKILNATPMSRFGEAEELIGALLFLVNEEASSFVNGIVIPIDGGFSAYSGV